MKSCIVRASWICVVLALILPSCHNPNSQGPNNLKGYTLSPLGNDFQYAEKRDTNGNLLSTGFLYQGKKTGTWTEYSNGRVRKVESYINGLLNGPVLHINDRNDLTKVEHYRNGKLHGLVAEYKFSRPLYELHYKDDKLHGKATYYFSNNGKVQKVLHYKMGKLHGDVDYYNDKGQHIMHYVYKNGKKISGEILQPTQQTNK